MTTATDALGSIAAQIDEGRLEAAASALNAIGETNENRLELLFLRGFLQEKSYDVEGALGSYQQVIEQNPDHVEAAFRAGLLSDQQGDDETAISLYEQCVEKKPAHANAMVNLAVLYEEAGMFERAEAQLTAVLADHPNHYRARQFLKSVKSSYTMVYDEATLKERDRNNAILDMPISDFELSVRSRNCLRQMNIRTLGDLLSTSEAELLSYKNFGETSLAEIKALLEQKELSLGLGVQPTEPDVFPSAPLAAGDDSIHSNRSIAELELSVRSRKALQRLGVSTLGELMQRSEAEMMAIKNFGLTSLTEIKRQLTKFGLSLRTMD